MYHGASVFESLYVKHTGAVAKIASLLKIGQQAINNQGTMVANLLLSPSLWKCTVLSDEEKGLFPPEKELFPEPGIWDIQSRVSHLRHWR
jgi:hypothetical protein